MMARNTTIYCCGCQADVKARLTDGREIYRHRPDLAGLPFWRCDTCRNYVGCHHKTADRTRPLGCIPTRAITETRQAIHRMLDPIWQKKRLSRAEVYARMSAALGREYHTAELRSDAEARAALTAARELAVAVQLKESTQ